MASADNKTAILFCRVSSTEQLKGGSHQTQERHGLEYAQQKGLTVTRVFKVAETASKKAQRIKWQEFLEYVRKDQAQHVLVASVDRALRNYHDLPEVQDLQIRFGKTVHFFLEGLVLDGKQRSTNDLRLGIQAAVSVWYAGELSEKVRRGMDSKARRGEWPTQAPYGYQHDRLTKKIVADPNEARWVRRILELMAEGTWSIHRVIGVITAEGCRLTGGRRMLQSMVERIIRNPIYAGQVEWPRGSGTLYPGVHEPLVSWDLHRRAVAGLERKNRPRVRKHDFLLAGMVRCGSCAEHRSVVVESKKGGRFHYAHCVGTRYIYHGAQKAKQCPAALFVPVHVLEGQLEAALAALQIDEATAEYVVGELAKDAGARAAEGEAQLALMRERVVRLQGHMDRAYEDRLENRITEDFWRDRNRAWSAEKVRLEEEIRQREEKGPASVIPTVRKLLELAKNIVPLYKSADVSEKRRLLNYVCSNWTLTGNKLEFSYNKPFDELVKGVQTGEWWAVQDAIRTFAASPQAFSYFA
jgi:site-specific DNA recombinase